MSTVKADITARVAVSYGETAAVGSAVQTIEEENLVQLNPGTGSGNGDKVFTAAINIAASGNASFNLTTALDAFGVALAMLKVKSILIEADPTNTNDIILGNGANPLVGPFGAGTHTLATKPGGMTLLATKDGYTVVPSTGDVVKLANSSSGTAVTGTLVIVGASA